MLWGGNSISRNEDRGMGFNTQFGIFSSFLSSLASADESDDCSIVVRWMNISKCDLQ